MVTQKFINCKLTNGLMYSPPLIYMYMYEQMLARVTAVYCSYFYDENGMLKCNNKQEEVDSNL